MEIPTTSSSYETTQETQPGVWALGSKGGLYTGLILVIYSLVTYVLEVPANSAVSTIFSVISFIVGIYLTHQAFKEQGNGLKSYGQGLGLGTVVGLVSGLLLGIFLALYTAFIDNTVIQKQLDQARIVLENQGMADAQVDQAMYFSELLISPVGLFFISVINCLFYAFIVALIVSIFTKKTDSQFEY